MDHTLDFIAGCLGGFAGVTVGHPFDTVKVRIQCDNNHVYKGVVDCFRTIIRQESVQGLYKGVASPLYSLALINAIVFGVQGNVLRRMENPNSLQSHFIAGAVAGGVQSIVCGPMELVKIKMQSQGQGMKPGASIPFSSSYDCLQKICKAEGVRGLGRGMVFTVVREVPAFGAYFLTYEWLCRQFTPTGHDYAPTSVLLIAGGLAGCVSWLSSYPIDVIKSRIQEDGVFRNGKFAYKYKGYGDCIKQSVKKDGMRVFFKGLNSTLARAFPTNAVTLTVVTWALRYLRPNESARERQEFLEAATAIAQRE